MLAGLSRAPPGVRCPLRLSQPNRRVAARVRACAAMAVPSRLILVGDLHGQLGKLETLWSRLEAHVGAAEFATAKVLFLGDYVDRGPDTKGVLDFLCALRTAQPRQQHVFLAGNHDYAMAAFLGLQGVLPAAEADAMAQRYVAWRKNEGALYAGPGCEQGMHLQGRRWAVNLGWNQVRTPPLRCAGRAKRVGLVFT